ncbi:MAG TPA: MMPL family transporter [Streptosporangiaceae bacterium]|nr:MMPL family transporter [Streptosporangiaceae bacterium]
MQLSDPSTTEADSDGASEPEPSHRSKPRHRPVVERIACWSARHRVIALIAWLLMVGGAVLAGHVYAAASQPEYDPGQSGVAERMLSDLHVVTPPSESVLIQSKVPGPERTFAAYPPLRLAARQVVAALRDLPATAANIQSPFGRNGKELIAPGGGGVLITFRVAGPNGSADTTVLRALHAVADVQARHPGLVVAEAGDASVDRAATALLGQDFHQAETTSIPLTLLLLLIVFGALIAASIPVILAGTAVTATVSLLTIPSRWLPIGQSTSEVVLIIGMAVGIDYTLFYLRREREERSAGASFHDALRTAAATSGRAIVVSGLTVMISLAGLLFTGIDMFTGFAIGTMTVVGVAVVGSLTALPAVLSLLGPWADRGRIPFLGKARTRADRSRLWGALVTRVVRRPVIWGGVSVLALAALALPALSMRLGSPSIDLPSNLPVVRTLALIQRDFPGGPAPAQVVVAGPGASSQQMASALAELKEAARSGGPIHGPVTALPVDAGHGALISVPLAGASSGNSNGADATSGLLALRNQILPRTLGRVPGVSFAVTGDTANSYDYRATLRSAAPLVFGLVAALAFLLLLVAFRSVTIPLVSIGLNLLSVGAAYGLITIIFQQGHLEGLLGFTSFGGIMDWVPLFMFVFLFGLSMDYHVFILSRIKELRGAGASTSDAVVGGIATGAGVVTSAAVIMVAVFSIFASLSTIDVKMIGVGLAFAVFVDATVVRGICVPAALALLGERSWYLPRWLRWLPEARC